MLEKHLRLGVYNTLEVNRQTQNGLYLKAEDEDEVLLPNIYVKPSMQIGDEIDVFLYTDSLDRVVATTLKPKLLLNEFAYLKVVSVDKFGIFLDWGLPKDLFVPKKEQKSLRVGDYSLFYLDLDHQTNRLYASQKIEKFLKKNPKYYKNQEVDIIIFAKTPMGYKVLIDQSYTGMIYENEIFEELTLGEERRAYIKKVRDDNKIDLSLLPIGTKSLDMACEKIIELLKNNNGKIELNYKSDAELIKKRVQISKKLYKKALTKLVEENRIKIENVITLKELE
ncbi:MAG: DNA-binding protein [Sulfurospirillum sp.]|nr:MAG: DNA-binding protein [Sulfurospirillum sp.]